MKLAITTWGDRTSPVFDVAQRLLLVDIEDGVEVGRREETILERELTRRAARVTNLGVHVLICGAISRPLEEMLLSAGVQVISQICGPVEDLLQAFMSGQLTGEAFLMPGCCGRRRHGRGRRGRHGRSGRAAFNR